ARHLAGRPEKYVPIDAALAGQGDALTIDDATFAGKHAAELARGHGHAVTLFVNPYHVTLARPYFFHRLSAMLDATAAAAVEFNGQRFALDGVAAREAFRETVKRRLCALALESER